jgi:hypothetical protein
MQRRPNANNRRCRKCRILCKKRSVKDLRFRAENIYIGRVTRRRGGTSAHIAAIALLIMEQMSSRKKIIVETGGPLVNRRSSAALRVRSSSDWRRVAGAESAARHLRTRQCDP